MMSFNLSGNATSPVDPEEDFDPIQASRIQRTIRIVIYIVVPAVIVALLFIQHQAFEQSRTLRQTVEASHHKRDLVRSILTLHQQSLAAQRGYLLTSHPDFFAEYEESRAEVDQATEKLASELASDPEIGSKAQELSDLTDKRLALIDQALELHMSDHTTAAFNLIRDRRGWQLAESVRQTLNEIDRVVEQRLAATLAASESANRTVNDLSTALQILLLLLFVGAGVNINQLLKRQRDAGLRYQELSCRQEAIFDNTMDGLLLHGPTGIVESVNPAVTELFGYEPQEIIGHNIAILFADPPNQERIEAVLVGVRKQKKKGIRSEIRELTGKRKDGTPIVLGVSTSPVQFKDGTHFVAVIRDITDRKNIERMKTEFVSTVSHELRTPLTSIAGSLGLLSGGAVGGLPERAQKLIGIAHANSARLVRLINDILDIEKIESGKMTFDIQAVPLRQTVEHVVLSNRPYADAQNVQVEIQPGFEDAVVRADPDRLVQVITNLLSNAIKFSPAGETVRVGISRNKRFYRIIVADKGPGVPAEFRNRIFGKFAQADSSATRSNGGTGLGLSIVKEIVEHLGGTVDFESTPGIGSEFYVDIPAEDRRQPQEMGQPASTPRKGNLRILHVDDDIDVLRVVESAFGDRASVRAAPSLQGARAQLAAHDFDLVILDLGLPDGPGIELLPELRSGVDKPIPVIVFSARDCEPNLSNMVDAVLTKSRASLDDLVDTAFRVAGARAPTSLAQEQSA